MSDTIIYNGRITTLDPANPEVEALAITDGKVAASGSSDEVLPLSTKDTEILDLDGRRVIPGLNDSHIHLIRGGLSFNLELRWENVPSVADALRMLREQAERTPPPQWVRVVGGWSEFQFAERRMPTLDEINAAAPDTPVFVLHLYARALLNKAALNAIGLTKTSPDPPGGSIQRDGQGNPTGLLLATPSALILYSTLAQGPSLPREDQINSTRHFMRELNRLGITSVIDAGGGGQNYPEDYEVVQHLDSENQLTVRIAYNLFAQTPGKELGDYERWVSMTAPGQGSALLKMNGGGENLTWSAADFENFLQPRPELASQMEDELEKIVELLATNKWPFRIHATYDESIDRFLSVFERVNGRQPFETRFIIDHAETISDRNIERVKALGGGIAIQNRMAYQGEYFVDRYGPEAAQRTPPIGRMLEMDLPVGAGTDATRVSSYDPWTALHWLVTGKTVGGLRLYGQANTLDRITALRLYTQGSAWFSGDQDVKGALTRDQYADLVVLSQDFLTIPEENIRQITAVLTMLGGRIVYAQGPFQHRDPPMPPVSPDWSPIHAAPTPAARTDDYALLAARQLRDHECGRGEQRCPLHGHDHAVAFGRAIPTRDPSAFWGALGCSCFAV